MKQEVFQDEKSPTEGIILNQEGTCPSALHRQGEASLFSR